MKQKNEILRIKHFGHFFKKTTFTWMWGTYMKILDIGKATSSFIISVVGTFWNGSQCSSSPDIYTLCKTLHLNIGRNWWLASNKYKVAKVIFRYVTSKIRLQKIVISIVFHFSFSLSCSPFCLLALMKTTMLWIVSFLWKYPHSKETKEDFGQ